MAYSVTYRTCIMQHATCMFSCADRAAARVTEGSALWDRTAHGSGSSYSRRCLPGGPVRLHTVGHQLAQHCCANTRRTPICTMPYSSLPGCGSCGWQGTAERPSDADVYPAHQHWECNAMRSAVTARRRGHRWSHGSAAQSARRCRWAERGVAGRLGRPSVQAQAATAQ
jgi:hypothetical protein